MNKKMYNDTQAAEILNCSTSKLRQDRHKGKGLAYVRLGRSIRYLAEDIEKFIEENRIQPSN